MKATSIIFAWIRGAIGAAIGGVAGYFLFFFLVSHSLYGLALPGGLLGLGCGLLSGRRSVAIATVCMFAATALGLYTEWQFAPFVADDSLEYFVMHIHELRGITKVMLLVGTAGAFLLGLGNDRRVRAEASEPVD